LKILPW